MVKNNTKFFLVIILIVLVAVIYTSYKTLVKKDFIIIEPEEENL